MGKDLKGKELGKGFGQRKDGRYEARAMINGKRLVMYDTNLAKLKRDFKEEKEKLERTSTLIGGELSVNEWFEEWFEKYKRPTLKPSGVSIYRRKYLNTYGEILGFIQMKELTQFAVQSATAELVEKKYSPKYIRDGLAVLKLMLDAAIGNRMIGFNPCLGVIVPTFNTIQQEERRVLTTYEQKLFLDVVNNSFYKELYHFMLLTGVRVGEMGALQWEDIDFQNGFITIRHTLNCQYENGNKVLTMTSPKTKNSYRRIPFFGETEKTLLEQKEKQNNLKKQLGNRWRATKELKDVDLVFTSSMGSPVTRYVLEHDLRAITKEMNSIESIRASKEKRTPQEIKGIYPHALRHTFATRCFEKNMGVETVQKIMGHSNIQMTMSYTHVLDNILTNAANNVGDFLSAD